MSAHRLYCYLPHKPLVVDFLKGLGAIISHDNPFPIDSADQLRGLEHITFIVVDHHAQRIPQLIWEAIVADGAIVIHIDDQYVRVAAEGRRLHVRHYERATPYPIRRPHGLDGGSLEADKFNSRWGGEKAEDVAAREGISVSEAFDREPSYKAGNDEALPRGAAGTTIINDGRPV